ncbi:hypothetical protein FB107DRAFT_280920 [Schizophyllum commune]
MPWPRSDPLTTLPTLISVGLSSQPKLSLIIPVLPGDLLTLAPSLLRLYVPRCSRDTSPNAEATTHLSLGLAQRVLISRPHNLHTMLTDDAIAT